MTVVADWGSNIVGAMESRERLGEDDKIQPGEEYEVVNEIKVEEPMTGHEWATLLGHVANKWAEKAPDGAELKYMSLERSSRPKLRFQFKAHQQATPTLLGLSVVELVKIIAAVVAAAVILYVGYETIDVVHSVANVIKSPFKSPGKTALVVGVGLVGLLIITSD